MTLEIDYEKVIGKTKVELSVKNLLGKELNQQRILVTGAGGSIGSKIVESISENSDARILATDRDENRLHTLSLNLSGRALFDSSDFEVLDVRDEIGVVNAVSRFSPTSIIHAAALKHLAVLERQPREAYLTNIVGTLNVLRAASSFNVKKLLNISTDKAANPTSILGKSKHVSEILTTAFRREGNLGFTSVRFGNVFNSRGSVIETFVKQIKSSQPVTLTHEEVRRYFMRIEDAASLSLVASVICEGDIHVLDMGEQHRLADIIQKLQEILGGHSKVTVVGLRQGEKLLEELWSGEELIKTSSVSGISIVDLPQKNLSREIRFLSVDSDVEAKREIEHILEVNSV